MSKASIETDFRDYGPTYPLCKAKQTNADRIRSMSDEELLDFICSIETYDEGSVKTIEGGSALCSVTDVEKWLQSEVEV